RVSRLVGEAHLGLARDAGGEVEPPALAAGEGRHADVGAVAEADEVEELHGRARVRVRGAVEVDALAHAQRLVDPLLLEDDADPGAERALALRRVVAEDADLAGV